MLGSYSQSIPSTLAKQIERKGTRLTKKYLEVIWIDKDFTRTPAHDFIEIFDFRPLEELERSLLESKDYGSKEISKLIQGLSRLPRYATKTTNKGRGTPRSRK